MQSDLLTIKQNASKLPVHAWYIVGLVQIKTDLSLDLVLNFVRKVYDSFEKFSLGEEKKSKIEYLLCDGKIGEVKNLLEQEESNLAGLKNNIENDLLRLMQELKNDPNYDQKVELKLEPQTSFTCGLCSQAIKRSNLIILEDCPDMFHQACISKNVKEQMQSNVERVMCPSKGCKVEIQLAHLELFVSKESIREYQENSFQNILKSGALGRFEACPNENCRETICVEFDTGFCPKCGINICGKCIKRADLCNCNQVINRRQCPMCTRWVDKGKERFIKCSECSYNFCFNCMNLPAICKCLRQN